MKIGLLFLPVFLALTVSATFGYEPRIIQLITTNNRQSIIVYSRLDGAFSEEVTAALREGLPLQFEFEVELYRERRGWPDQLLGSVKLTHAVKYDILKERYIFTASYRGEEPKRTTTSLKEVQDWMNTIDGASIAPMNLLDKGRRYYLRMQAILTAAGDFFERNIFFFFKKSGHYRTGWQRSPLFGLGDGRRS